MVGHSNIFKIVGPAILNFIYVKYKRNLVLLSFEIERKVKNLNPMIVFETDVYFW